MRPSLSVVLPAYNEQENIERAVRSALEACTPLVPALEIVAVDDGSRDRTGAILQGLETELGGRLQVVRHERNQGYGAALRHGFLAAQGELVFYTDADNQFDLTEMAGFLPLMADHDAVLATAWIARTPGCGVSSRGSSTGSRRWPSACACAT